MPISAGTCLGSYELLVQIGVGGMGEVYKAHGTKLGATWPSRFCRKCSRMIPRDWFASSANYLVVELVQGQTLADRIK